MKTFLLLCTLLSFTYGHSQYYYQDILGTRESANLMQTYKANKVKTVGLRTYTINRTPLDNLSVRQEFDATNGTLRTITTSDFTDASYLVTYVDAAAKLIKSVDSSSKFANTTTYTYNSNGRLSSILFTSGDTLSSLKKDEHQWTYDNQGRVSKMIRIKNSRDSSVVNFKLDGNGNVIEEQESKRVSKEEPFYYYYDENNRLTDIVRFNKKVNRLLPEAILYYDENNWLIQRYTIPPGSDNYLIWRFEYNKNGLKTREKIFNKEKEETGMIEYSYGY